MSARFMILVGSLFDFRRDFSKSSEMVLITEGSEKLSDETTWNLETPKSSPGAHHHLLFKDSTLGALARTDCTRKNSRDAGHAVFEERARSLLDDGTQKIKNSIQGRTRRAPTVGEIEHPSKHLPLIVSWTLPFGVIHPLWLLHLSGPHCKLP